MLKRTLIAAIIFYAFFLPHADASIFSNCLICHDPLGALNGKLQIDGTPFGQSVHGKMNAQSADIIIGPFSGACWACHDSDGVVIADEDGMGDRYKNPFNCTACHLPGGEKEGAYGAPLIFSHFSGGKLKVGLNNISSCISCHEIQGMVLNNVDADTGSFAGDGERINGGSLSYYHYGKNRTDLKRLAGTSGYCTYCHSNQSEFNAVFRNIANRNVLDHSLRFPSPACQECHGNNGNLHSPNLEKPLLSDTLCLGCHAPGRATGPKSDHNGTVKCTACHGNVHPVTYLQQNATFGTKIDVRCPGCHESGFINAPVIPPLQHSDNPANGSIFGSYWDTKIGSCYYCHGNTLHEQNAFGKTANIRKGPRNSTDFKSFWCSNCHYNSTPQEGYLYNGTAYTPPPPEITNPRFFNHSRLIISDWSDAFCKNCHGRFLVKNTTSEFVHNVSVGPGGPDCAGCHDKGGIAPKLIDFQAFKEGVHRSLNSRAANSTSLSETVDKACWACHGEGDEPAEHPARYKNPRRCGDNECHSLSQSFRAPMLYSHFKDADLNSNPTNSLNYNVSTTVSCEACHSNSLIITGENPNASVPHYASRKELIDSINCIYCHLDRENAVKWGNATEINKNRSALTELYKERNKFSARMGEFIDLGQGYRIKVNEISIKRGTADIELYKVGKLVDTALVNTGDEYVFEEERIIDNASTMIPVIALNITGMFISGSESFMQFEGSRIKRVHYESRTTACYLCHFNGGMQKRKYTVIDRRDEYVYYTEVLFNSSDRNEYDQAEALLVLAGKTPADAHTDIERAKRKTLKQGEKWELAGNYMLTLEDVSENSDSVKLLLEAGDKVYTNAVGKGEVFEFEYGINYLGYRDTNITIFRANVSEIMPDIVVLEDIMALSPEIKKIKDDTTISGYNTSWLWENNTFLLGRIPGSFHSPLVHDGRDGSGNCVSCHRVEFGFSIELGAHAAVNRDARGSVSANGACWACHGDGTEPRWHPATYKKPVECKSCHVEQKGLFNATYIGDEIHGTLGACGCHVTDIHKITLFRLGLPAVTNISLLRQENKTKVAAFAIAGYKMKVRDARYYIDTPQEKFRMHPQDGAFDSQTEEIFAEIDTSNMSPGKHVIYVEAMQRMDKWGAPASIVFDLEREDSSGKTLSPDIVTMLVVLAAFLVRKRLRSRQP